MKAPIKYILHYLLNLIVKNKFFKSILQFEVTITGGFGSQLISISAANRLHELGYSVKVNTEYFKTFEHLDTGITHFKLDKFISTKIKEVNGIKSGIHVTLHDSPLKFLLGLQSIINNRDNLREELRALVSPDLNLRTSQPTIVIHVRRGDFLNVADFVKPIKDQVSNLSEPIIRVSAILVLTDSPDLVKEELKELAYLEEFSTNFQVLGPNDGTIYDVITIMTQADVLIASNSQLSLIASILNDNIAICDINNFVSDRRYIANLKLLTRAVSLWKA